MSDYAIRAEGLSKRYRIGKAPQHRGRWDAALHTLSSPFRYLASSLQAPSAEETIWALNKVDLEVRQGEVLGVVGRNGAGKSTLLKILSRITEPTTGKAWVNGRVGSLLEVGTGFHPELTGRENVFLNGAILGMKRAETERKFATIVDFAEIGKFIDTPVKRYSSGMYVRLAFSVAAHLEPEILLVDEVLAVGDLAFQNKCLQRMQELTASGMTILLVSHNMAAIQSSCHRAVWIEKGGVAADGDPIYVIDQFRGALRSSGVQEAISMTGGVEEADGKEQAVSILGFQMSGEDGADRRDFRFGEPVRIRIDLHASRRIENPMINFGIRRGDGVVVCNFNNWYDNFSLGALEGDCTLEGWLPPLRLTPDFYEIHVLVWPWGGGHTATGLEQGRPIAWVTFGDFRIGGPALNSHDGVFQAPARKWRFTSEKTSIESPVIAEDAIYRVLD